MVNCLEIVYLLKLTLQRGASLNRSRIRKQVTGFPGGTVVKNPPANAGDTGSSPGP